MTDNNNNAKDKIQQFVASNKLIDIEWRFSSILIIYFDYILK